MDDYPSGTRMESLRAADESLSLAAVVPYYDVVDEGPGQAIQARIQPSYGGVACIQSGGVDQRHHRSYHRS